MKVKFLREVHSQKQRRFMCAMKEPGADRPKDLEKDEAEEMCTGPMKEEQLDEISAMGGGAVGGTADSEEEDDPLEEMYSTKGSFSAKMQRIQTDKEHEGRVERGRHQGLQNYKENKNYFHDKWRLFLKEGTDSTYPLSDSDFEQIEKDREDDGTQDMKGGGDSTYSHQSTAMKLRDFTEIHRNVSRMMYVYDDILNNIGKDKLQNAVLMDQSAPGRISVMENKFGYESHLADRIFQGEEEALHKYYQFVITEFLYYIAHNPKASARMYSGRSVGLTKPTQDLAYGMIHRYVSHPNENNPRAMSDKMSREAETYKLDKDLDSALYDLPEE